MPVLTDAEKERVRYHTGYMETSFAASLQMGIPRPIQTIFLLEQAMSLLVADAACDRVRGLLCRLDAIEEQLFRATKTLVAEKLGEMVLHPLRGRGVLATDSIEGEDRRWAHRLADILGIPLYPYSTRFQRSGPGTSIMVR